MSGEPAGGDGPGNEVAPMNGYVYEQFGMWWVFLGETRVDGKKLRGPFRSREQAAASLHEPWETHSTRNAFGAAPLTPVTH
jgi:hypothetical protein